MGLELRSGKTSRRTTGRGSASRSPAPTAMARNTRTPRHSDVMTCCSSLRRRNWRSHGVSIRRKTPSEKPTKSNGISTGRWVQPTCFTDENAMIDVDQIALFRLGRVVATPGVISSVPPEDTVQALLRHSQGDWGDMCDEDRIFNDDALERGLRLLSVYHASNSRKFWIITEADRSVTTILLPEEY